MEDILLNDKISQNKNKKILLPGRDNVNKIGSSPSYLSVNVSCSPDKKNYKN